MIKVILRLAFIVWIALWAFFTFREMFLKSSFRDYKILLSRSLEGKRAYVAGDRLYEFITFCEGTLPQEATYDLMISIEGDIEIAKMRAVYYLYPRIKKERADFILVCDAANIQKDEYEMFGRLDETRYILKKRGM